MSSPSTFAFSASGAAKPEVEIINLGTNWSSGDLLGARVTTPPVAHKLDLRDGTAASPVKIGVSASFSRTDATTRAEVNAMGPEGTDGPDGATVLRTSIKGTAASEVQISGIVAQAWQTGAYASAGADAGPILALARVSGGATGRAIPLYAESVIETATARGGQGIEVRVKNSSGESHSYEPNASSKSMGMWINASSAGEADSAAAIQVGKGFSRQFDVGFGFNEGSVKTATFRDDSTSLRSILIAKPHEKAAIAVAAAAGQVVIGAETPASATPLLEVFSAEGLDPITNFGSSAAAKNYSIRLQNSAGICKLLVATTEGFGYTGTKAGDAGAVFTPAKAFHIGAAGKTSMVRVEEAKIGLFGVAPTARAAAITSPAAELAALKTAVDKLREALKNIGITE